MLPAHAAAARQVNHRTRSGHRRRRRHSDHSRSHGCVYGRRRRQARCSQVSHRTADGHRATSHQVDHRTRTGHRRRRRHPDHREQLRPGGHSVSSSHARDYAAARTRSSAAGVGCQLTTQIRTLRGSPLLPPTGPPENGSEWIVRAMRGLQPGRRRFRPGCVARAFDGNLVALAYLGMRNSRTPLDSMVDGPWLRAEDSQMETYPRRWPAHRKRMVHHHSGRRRRR